MDLNAFFKENYYSIFDTTPETLRAGYVRVYLVHLQRSSLILGTFTAPSFQVELGRAAAGHIR